MGIQQVRLYTNTVSTVPTTFTDVTAQFSGLNPNTVADETASATITIPNLLPPGTTTFAWIEAIDEAGISSGVQSVGSATTRERCYVGYGAPNTGVVATSSSLAGGSLANLYNIGLSAFISGARWPQWVQYELPAPRKLTRYRLRHRGDGVTAPSGWQILGSNDGITFQLVHDVNLPSGQFIPQNLPPSGATSILDIPDDHFYLARPNSGSLYKFYRLLIDGRPTSNGEERIALSHWALTDEP